MELSRYLSNVLAVLKEDFRSAASMLAEADISDLTKGLVEGYAKEYNKDLKRRAQQDKALAPHYAGIPNSVAKWGKEAHSYGLHAHGMEKGGKAPKHKIVDAHSEAGKAHHFAYRKLDSHGYKDTAELHKRAAKYHRQKVSELGGDDLDEAAGDDLRAANTHAHMAQWRAGQLKKKLAAKSAAPKPQLKYAAVVKPAPKTEGLVSGAKKLIKAGIKNAAGELGATMDSAGKIGAALATGDRGGLKKAAKGLKPVGSGTAGKLSAYASREECGCDSEETPSKKSKKRLSESLVSFFFLGEGYEDAVKQASLNAARRSKVAQSHDDHKHAATLHGIAADVAKAHGHDDLAGKHSLHKQKHLDTMASLKKSVSG